MEKCRIFLSPQQVQVRMAPTAVVLGLVACVVLGLTLRKKAAV
jgi:hypothetical protein